MRRTAPAILALLGLFVLTGCFKVDMDLTVQPDDTVDGTMIVAFDRSFLDMMGSLGEEGMDPSELFDTSDLPEGSTIEEYDEGGFVGERVTLDGADLAELSESTSGEEQGELTIRRDGDVYRVEGAMDMTQEGGEDLLDMDEMMGDAELRVRLTFPGEVTESNGAIDGRSVTWEPKMGERNEMTAVAQAEEESDSSTAMIAAVAVGSLLAVGAVATLLVLRLRKTRPTPTP